MVQTSHSTPTGTILSDALDGALTTLRAAVADPSFAGTVTTAFGEQADREAIADLLHGMLVDNRLPEVRAVPAATLRGADAAYDSTGQTILVSADLLVVHADQPEAIERVLLEEIGHHIDAAANAADATGDEGAIFARLLTDGTLPADALAALKAEDDHGAVTVDGRTVPVEFAAQHGDITLDGTLADWTAEDRLEVPGSGVDGYELYGKHTGDSFVFALKSDAAAIGENTTFWLNTDQNLDTGYKIWGFAGGAEYNVNFDAAGVPTLFTGAAGETPVAVPVDYAYSADGKTVELAIASADLAGAPQAANVLVDVNDTVFLPNDYEAYPLTVAVAQPETPPGPEVPPETVGAITLDGAVTDWTAADRLELPGSGVDGFELYGRQEGDAFVFALSSDTTVIGDGTTFWLNTDQNAATGHQIWGFAGGAEYNVDFSGGPKLYTGADGETLVSATLAHAFSADGRTVEFAVQASQLAGAPASLDLHVDVNNEIFLPIDYEAFTYTVGAPTTPEPPAPPPAPVGTVEIDGDLADWTSGDRLEVPGSGVDGYALYGKVTGDAFVFALKADNTTLGEGTTIWLNTDQDKTTGHQIWDFAGGAEYNINFDAAGVPSLYTGNAGETLVVQGLAHAYSADGTTVEVALPRSMLAGAPQAVDLLVDVNDEVFLPVDYSAYTYTVKDAATLPPQTDNGIDVAIVFSETTAAQFFSDTAYSQLFMAVQNQAMMAGVPFDVLTEADLTDLSKLVDYETIVFPSFSHVAADKLAAIESNLISAVYDYGIGLVTGGDFMTNDETGAALGDDPYARMKTLFDITRAGGGTGDVTLQAGDAAHGALDGYQADEVIRTDAGIGYSVFEGISQPAAVLADQTVDGQTYNAVVATETGGRNVHFSTTSQLADNNMLWQAIEWSAHGDGPTVGLQLSRNSSIVASRTDMDQSQETYDVSPDGNPGIYDTLLPILADWKETYDFVGSYYINVGDNPPDQETDWSISGPYYQQLLAMGNEIGSHSFTHPHNTDELTPAEIEYEFNQATAIIEQQLGITVHGAAVPGAPESLATAREIGQYFDYLSGGYSAAGSGYPGAFGYLTPGDTDLVYLAPNVTFDFTQVDFLGLSAEEAAEAWAAEWETLTSHADVPVVLWPWHDYGPTQWMVDDGIDSRYSPELFESFIRLAHDSSAEFVTLNDLAERIASFEKAGIKVETNGDTITAEVTATDAGKFALDVDGGQTIASVDGWYAYDDDSVFLPRTGGQFTINLGAAQDVTHIVALPSRAELLAVDGDGTNLSFSALGEGRVVIDLKDPAGQFVDVQGATVVSLVGDRLELDLGAIGQHDVTVTMLDGPPNTPPTITSDGAGDTAALVVDENTLAVTTVTADDPDAGARHQYAIAGGADADRFAIDADTGALSFAQAPDYEVPADADADNVYDVTLQVSDDRGATDTQALSVMVSDVVGVTRSSFFGGGTLTGTGEEDALQGGFFSTQLDGLAGDDRLIGGISGDTLDAGDGNDVLDGGSGNDRLIGGRGADTITGGSGDDTFVYTSADDSNALYGSDLLADFTPGRDGIDLSAIDANTTAAGDQAFELLADGADFTAAGQLRVVQDAATGATRIEGNVDAALGADFQIDLTGAVEVTKNDFVL